MLLSGLGIGVLFPAHSLAVQASVPQNHIAIAIVMSSFFRSFGQAAGIAVGGVIFQNRFRKELEAFPDLASNATRYSLDAVALVEIIKSLPQNSIETIYLKTAFANALKAVWEVMCGLSGLALLASLVLKRYDLDQGLQTEQGFVSGAQSIRPVALRQGEALPVNDVDLDERRG
jgi:ABC-type long-subunit fatty acid transport system fused permease/ATPase subunit